MRAITSVFNLQLITLLTAVINVIDLSRIGPEIGLPRTILGHFWGPVQDWSRLVLGGPF